MPLPWRPGGPWDDPGTVGSTRKDTWRSRLGFLLIFDGLRDRILRAFWVLWTKRSVFVYACLQVSFSVGFGGLNMSGLGINFHDFCCLGDWLEI